MSGMGSGGPDDNDAQAGRIVSFKTSQQTANGDNVSEGDVMFTLGQDVSTFGVSTIAQPVRSNPYNNSDPGMEAKMHIVTHALTSEGHDASEDGTGRGTPLVVEE